MSGESGGAIASALINSASTYYSQRKARKAGEAAQAESERATKVAQDRQAKMMKEADARTQAQADRNATRQVAANRPIGESATIDFGKKSNKKTGSSLDFLVPKIGGSQLGGGSNSGLGV